MPENDPPHDAAHKPEDAPWADGPAELQTHDSAEEPEEPAEPEESGPSLSPTPPGDEELAPGEAVEQLLPALEQTGHEGVDAALATLDGLASASVDEHVAVFEATHEELRRALNDVAATVSTPEDPPVEDPPVEDLGSQSSH